MFEEDPRLDVAMETYPLAPTPPGLRDRVMAEVRRLPRAARLAPPAGVRYRLEFLDLVLPVFFAFFGLLILAVPLVVLLGVDPLRVHTLRLYLQAFFTGIPDLALALAGGLVAIGLVGMAAALVAALFWLSPRRVELKTG